MAERKQKRESEEIADIEEGSGTVLEPTQIELGSGYTLAISYEENDRPVVNIKTYGQVDIVQLRREIERIFPNAEIRAKSQAATVTVAKKNKKKLAAAKRQRR